MIVVSGYYPPHLGGVETCAFDYSRELTALGHEVEVLTSAVGAQRGMTYDGQVPVRRLAVLDAAHTPFVPGLPAALWRAAPGKVIHLHLSHVITDVVTAAVGRLRSVPIVMHFHMDVQPSGPLGRVFTAYKRFILPQVLRSAQWGSSPSPPSSATLWYIATASTPRELWSLRTASRSGSHRRRRE